MVIDEFDIPQVEVERRAIQNGHVQARAELAAERQAQQEAEAAQRRAIGAEYGRLRDQARKALTELAPGYAQRDELALKVGQVVAELVKLNHELAEHLDAATQPAIQHGINRMGMPVHAIAADIGGNPREVHRNTKLTPKDETAEWGIFILRMLMNGLLVIGEATDGSGRVGAVTVGSNVTQIKLKSDQQS